MTSTKSGWIPNSEQATGLPAAGGEPSALRCRQCNISPSNASSPTSMTVRQILSRVGPLRSHTTGHAVHRGWGASCSREDASARQTGILSPSLNSGAAAEPRWAVYPELYARRRAHLEPCESGTLISKRLDRKGNAQVFSRQTLALGIAGLISTTGATAFATNMCFQDSATAPRVQFNTDGTSKRDIVCTNGFSEIGRVGIYSSGNPSNPAQISLRALLEGSGTGLTAFVFDSTGAEIPGTSIYPLWTIHSAKTGAPFVPTPKFPASFTLYVTY